MQKIKFALTTLLLYISNGVIFSQLREEKITVYFDKNQYELSDNNRMSLSNFVADIELETIELILISGHTDDVNSKPFNENLSLKRAQAVSDYFKEKGLMAKEIKLQHESYENPIVPNNSEEHKAKNRRVEVLVKIDLLLPIPQPPQPEPSIEAVIIPVETPKTVTRIEANKVFECKDKYLPDTLIVYTAKGTELKLSTEDFKECCQTGGQLKVDVAEAISPQEVAASGWTTRSNGQFLASGGMLSIKITCGNEPLEYKGCFTLEFPIQEREGLDLYISNGKDNPDWQRTNEGNMVYNPAKNCYVINYCGGIKLEGILMNTDKMMLTESMLVKVRRHRMQNPFTTLLLEDGTMSVTYNDWPKDKTIPRRFNLISMIPSKASGTGQYTLEKTGKTYETTSIISINSKRPTRDIYLKDKSKDSGKGQKKKVKYKLLRRTKIKYKKCKFSCY